MCYSHFNDLHTRTKEGVCIIGHAELIFCKNNFESTPLMNLFDQFETTNRVGERAIASKNAPIIGKVAADSVVAE